MPGSPYWYVEIRGKRRSLKTPHEPDARRIVAEIRAKDETNQGADTSPKFKTMTITEFKKTFLEWSKGIHTDGTTETNRNSLARLVEHIGEDCDVREIKRKDLEDLMSAMRKKGRAPSYCNITMRHCRAALQKAVDWGYLDTNPFAGIKKLPVERKPPSYIPASKVKAFLSTIKDQDFKLLLASYLVTGRRRIELLRLTWADVDFENSRYYIRGKAHLSRWFPMSTSFRTILGFMPQGKPTDRVWGRWKDPNTVSHATIRFLRAAGYGTMHLHDMRHTFSINYLEAGGEIRALQDLLGHTQISCTTIYGKITQSHAAKEIERIAIEHDALV